MMLLEHQMVPGTLIIPLLVVLPKSSNPSSRQLQEFLFRVGESNIMWFTVTLSSRNSLTGLRIGAAMPQAAVE
jgi:hypothetical protein